MNHDKETDAEQLGNVDEGKQFVDERKALHDKWFGRESFKDNFGTIRPDRLEDPAFIARVRDVFAEEVEHELTFPKSRATEEEFLYPSLIRQGKQLPRSVLLLDKLARISQDLRLGDEYFKLKEIFFGVEPDSLKKT